jgi:hypothetical protein
VDQNQVAAKWIPHRDAYRRVVCRATFQRPLIASALSSQMDVNVPSIVSPSTWP